MVASAHDCSDGGLAVTLAECCFGADSGAVIDIDKLDDACDNLDEWGVLFGESLGRIIVSISPDRATAFVESMKGNSCKYLGRVIEGDQIIVKYNETEVLQASMSELKAAWQATLDGGAN